MHTNFENEQRQSIALLGSTGSIGTQTLEVVQKFPKCFNVVALAAGDNLECLADQVNRFHPKLVVIRDSARVDELRAMLPSYSGKILSGDEALCEVAVDDSVDALVVGIVGMLGLKPTLTSLKAGKRVITANKETFVTGGHLVAPYLEQIIPIDSEHSAIYQCVQGESLDSIRTIYLTASGGPFRKHTQAELASVTLAEALNHPNWVMGQKVTIDSATMMNKGLEVIEAHWLFGVPYEKVQIVVHPQSVLHSAVEFVDGSVMAQMGAPDMRVPIQYAMGKLLDSTRRLAGEYPGSCLDLFNFSQLDIERPDTERFPCIRLAYEAGKLGSSATAVLNAADEVAVAMFLKESIGFSDIPRLIEMTLEAHRQSGLNTAPTLDEIVALDVWARRFVTEQALRVSA